MNCYLVIFSTAMDDFPLRVWDDKEAAVCDAQDLVKNLEECRRLSEVWGRTASYPLHVFVIRVENGIVVDTEVDRYDFEEYD